MRKVFLLLSALVFILLVGCVEKVPKEDSVPQVGEDVLQEGDNVTTEDIDTDALTESTSLEQDALQSSDLETNSTSSASSQAEQEGAGTIEDGEIKGEHEPYQYVPPSLKSQDQAILREGEFEPIHRSVFGKAIIFKEEGVKKLMLKNFRIDPGAKLKVYLTRYPNPTNYREIGDEFVEVGSLESYFGDYTYTLPKDIDENFYSSVVIYSSPYKAVYASALLE